MVQSQIEAFLQQKFGITAKIIGSDMVRQAIEKRRLAANLADMEAYWYHLQSNAFELNQLIELIVIPETWFFRDWYPFNFLNEYVATEWLPARHGRPLRILSIPCASGEEPYSIAMMLLNNGMKSSQFTIDGLDISQESINRARAGIYTNNSFRGNNLGATLEFQRRYFTVIEHKNKINPIVYYQLHDEIKSCVKFDIANLLDINYYNDIEAYDLIFCRNVLIYFDAESRQKAIKNVHHLLVNQGLLFVGHAESNVLMETRLFTAIRHPFTFVHRKKAASETYLETPLKLAPSHLPINHFAAPNQGQNLTNRPALNSPKYLPKKDLPNKASHENLPTQKITNKSGAPSHSNQAKSLPVLPNQSNNLSDNLLDNLSDVLANAQELADRGYLNQARDICQSYINQNSTDANAYVLLGQIHQAQGIANLAIQNFEKAIYLAPDHYEALLHLALIKENQGDLITASILRQRIQGLPKFRNQQL